MKSNRFTMFDIDSDPAPSTSISKSTDAEGGTLRIKGGALIDGKLTKVTIISTDNSRVQLSVTAVLETCIIECQDLIIEGSFSGEINAKGDVELGSTCTVKGKLNHVGRVLINGLADAVDMHTRKIKATSAEPLKRSPSFLETAVAAVTG